MYVLLAYGYLGDRFQAWYLKLCIQSSNYVHTIKLTELIIKFLSGKILLPPPKNQVHMNVKLLDFNPKGI